MLLPRRRLLLFQRRRRCHVCSAKKEVTLPANLSTAPSAFLGYATSGFIPPNETKYTTVTTSTAETCYSSYRATVSGVTKSNHSCTHAIPPTAPTTSYSSTTSPELATGHSSGGSTITVKATATATVTIPWNSGALSGRFFTQTTSATSASIATFTSGAGANPALSTRGMPCLLVGIAAWACVVW